MTGYKILVVEDDGLIAQDISASLKHLGHTVVDYAASGEIAIKKAAELMPDLVLMDIVLQGAVDGIKAAGHISSQYDIPVIYLTSQSDPATIKRAKETEPYGYLRKPYDEKDLRATIEMALYRHGMQKKLRDSEQWLSIILRSITDAVVATDPRGNIGFVNPAAEGLIGRPARDCLGRPVREVFGLRGEGGTDLLPLVMAAAGSDGKSPKHSDCMLTSQGRSVPVDVSASPVRNEHAEITGVVIVLRDVSDRLKAHRAVEKSERFLNTIFDSIHDPFCIFDSNMRIVRLNEAYARLKGKAMSDVVGGVCHEVLQASDKQCEDCIIRRTFKTMRSNSKEKAATFPDGTEGWVEILTYPIIDEEGGASHVIEYTRDISSRRRADEERRRLILELEYLSRVDPLTGLLNRRALMDFINQEVDRSKRYGRKLSIMLCDIDYFKQINDNHGHAVGDIAIEHVAKVLRQMVRKTDMVGRYGGDEFMMVMPETGLSGAGEFSERIRQSIAKGPLSLGGARSVSISLSMGVTELDVRADSVDSVISRADAALYESKEKGRNRVSLKAP